MQYEKDMASPHRELFLSATDHLLSYQSMVEIRKPRITTFSLGNGGICHMRTMPHGIDIGFLKGARMEDQYRRLTGKGKAMRVLPLVELEVDVVDYYVQQAIGFVE